MEPVMKPMAGNPVHPHPFGREGARDGADRGQVGVVHCDGELSHNLNPRISAAR